MEKIDPYEDLKLEVGECLTFSRRTADMRPGTWEGSMDVDRTMMLMLIKRLDSIDKTLSDLIYKKEK